jgi:hypothetical protein
MPAPDTGSLPAGHDTHCERLLCIVCPPCRSQLWQWVRHGAKTSEGRAVTPDWVAQLLEQEVREGEGGRVAGREGYSGGGWVGGLYS